jgi:hypothetical protein
MGHYLWSTRTKIDEHILARVTSEIKNNSKGTRMTFIALNKLWDSAIENNSKKVVLMFTQKHSTIKEGKTSI